MKEEISELFDYLKSSRIRNFPKNLRLFLIDEDAYIWIYKGELEYAIGHNYRVFLLNLNRGKILDLFSKLEFIVNEIIQLELLGFNSEKSYLLDDILENVDLFSRIRLLKEWNVIDNTLLNQLMQIKQVRNGFAHAWKIKTVKYKGDLIKKKFGEFRDDMNSIVTNLILIYNSRLEESANIDSIRNIKRQLQELNP
jgi:hypothetical protein